MLRGHYLKSVTVTKNYPRLDKSSGKMTLLIILMKWTWKMNDSLTLSVGLQQRSEWQALARWAPGRPESILRPGPSSVVWLLVSDWSAPSYPSLWLVETGLAIPSWPPVAGAGSTPPMSSIPPMNPILGPGPMRAPTQSASSPHHQERLPPFNNVKHNVVVFYLWLGSIQDRVRMCKDYLMSLILLSTLP